MADTAVLLAAPVTALLATLGIGLATGTGGIGIALNLCEPILLIVCCAALAPNFARYAALIASASYGTCRPDGLGLKIL